MPELIDILVVPIDLWELPTDRQTASLSDEVERNFYARCPPEKRPIEFQNIDTQASSSSNRTSATIDEDVPDKSEKVATDPEKFPPDLKDDDVKITKQKTSKSSKSKANSKPKHDASLLKALHTTFFWRWWIAGALKLISGVLKRV
jgi:ATP-binding cassette, subfamily C (CFTR/MRP), member 1